MQESLGQIRWKCRRGMWELEIILLSFLENHYQSLTAEEQQQFVQLLDASDPDLYDWFLRQGESQDKSERAMVELILKKTESPVCVGRAN